MPSLFVMDLRQLATLLAVVDNGGFTAASRSLHTVQSNVSAHISRLEKELGATLIDRATGLPTAEGQVVVERARRIQTELSALTADVHSVRSEISGTARIGIIGTTARWLAPALIDVMSIQHPLVRVEVHDATTASLLLKLNSSAVDLAVLTTPTNDPEVVATALFTEDRILATPAGHSLFGKTRVTLADLDGIELIVEPPGRPFREQLDALFAERDYTLAVKAEVDGTRLMASLAFEGFGAAILPASAVSARSDLGWHTAPVEGLPGRAVGLATRRQALLSAPARALADVLRDVVSSRGERQPGIHPASPQRLSPD
jgi:LysR family hydrogen peroxide-inducible transcriptional activator